MAWTFALGVVPPAFAVDLAALRVMHTDGDPEYAYRAIETPGRRNGERIPLIVFLHGSGQNGADNASQLGGYGNGSLELVDAALVAGIPLVYAAPQVDADYWPPAQVLAVVRDALARFPIDPRRVLVTGISDGGTGTWSTLKAYPSCFAAGVPMSGMTELAGLASIRDVPQWIFHGARDNDTDIETGYGGAMLGSRAIVRALRAMGAVPRYTEYAEGWHPIWHQAYGEDALLPWMLRQRRRGPLCAELRDGPAGASRGRRGAGPAARR
ncbi:MAG: prolyl oligopeptidase family serine peptidase [Xanthomonadales bacterium]|nr:prolyl oligopeptidase family serine peptidase [Xanthomonadales bacterium]